MEVSPTVLIVGCGKLGIKIGENLNEQFNIVGIKRKSVDDYNDFRMIYLDVFDPLFDKTLKSIDPKYVVYAVSADDQSPLSYKNAYFDGVKKSIRSISDNCTQFKHLFFISSTRVYGSQSNILLTESTIPKPHEFGGKALYDGELLVANSDLSATTLRLSGIYGAQRTHLVKIAKEQPLWPEKNRWTNRIHDEDIVNFISHLLNKLENNCLIETLYLLTDNKPAKLFDVLNFIRSSVGLNSLDVNKFDSVEGKQLKSITTKQAGFIFKYPDYKSGYRSIILDLNKQSKNSDVA